MIKKAKVLSNYDPEVRERLKVAVEGVHDFREMLSLEDGVWAEHCLPYKYSSGGLPVEGDFVYVWYTPDFVVWLGLVIHNNIKTEKENEKLKKEDKNFSSNIEISRKTLIKK